MDLWGHRADYRYRFPLRHSVLSAPTITATDTRCHMPSRPLELLCTLGPSSLNERAITRMAESGVTLFRLNLSHIAQEHIEESIVLVQRYTTVPVCLDTEGPQIRTCVVDGGTAVLTEGATVRLVTHDGPHGQGCFQLRPADAVERFLPGDLVSVDFDSVLLNVAGRDSTGIVAHVICGGKVGSNKAVTVDRYISMPIFTDKDLAGVELIRSYGLEQISLSFVNCRQDVERARELLGPRVRLISKIETTEALRNLDDIAAASDALLIDRGDLSREQPIAKIPLLQRAIIEHGHAHGRPVFVATNLLESMVTTRKPLRSEVNDIMSTLLSGADGLVLAAETAIGSFPIECTAMVQRMARYHAMAREGYSLDALVKNDAFLLIDPHGGFLVDRYQPAPEEHFGELPRVVVDRPAIMDLEQIGIGTYSPITGFFTREQLDSVLHTNRLPSGVPWTLPITLQVSRDDWQRAEAGTLVALVLNEDGRQYGTMQVSERFTMDLEAMALSYFQTSDRAHPGVSRLLDKGNCFLGGDITLTRRLDSPYKDFEFTPRQTRHVFEHLEWRKIAGFHTRNAVHRAHEFLQLTALEKHHLDGIFLHPVVGPKKKDDFEASAILDSYRIAMEHYYPRGRFTLGAFSTYSRYAGPREAVFTAICRKNFGCSHFIVGRDHTGVKQYYSPGASADLFESIGELGITPIVFDEVYHCSACGAYVEHCAHGSSARNDISGTQARAMLSKGERPPGWFLRERITDMLLERRARGEDIFVR